MSDFYNWARNDGRDDYFNQNYDSGNSLYNSLDMQDFGNSFTNDSNLDLYILPTFEVFADRSPDFDTFDWGSPGEDVFGRAEFSYDRGDSGSGGGGSRSRASDTPAEEENVQESVENGVKPGETTERYVTINGQRRSYRLHLPEGYDESKDTPLILVYHGVNSDAAEMEQVSMLSEKADRDGFAVVYMDGNPDNRMNSWNNRQRAFSKADDISFTREVLDTVSSDFNVDQENVYAIGFSQGESMVHQLANDESLGERFEAVGVVGGWMTGHERTAADSLNPDADDISIITIKSNSDPISPAGGKFNFWFANMRPESYDENYYRNRNEIEGPPNREAVRNADGNVVRYESHSTDPDSGARVSSIRLLDEGHVWTGPGDVRTVHPENDSSEMILDFFGLSRDSSNSGYPVSREDYSGSIEPPRNSGRSINRRSRR